MTLSPEEFRRRFGDAVADEPDLRAVVGDAVAQGDRALRGRRVVAAVVAVVVLAGLGTTVDLLQRGGRTEDPAPAPTSTATTAGDEAAFPSGEELINLCRSAAKQSRRHARAFFASGTPEIKAVSDVGFQGSVALESADRKYWAWCRLSPRRPEENALDIFIRAGIGDGGVSGLHFGGLDCEIDGRRPRGCSTFTYRFAQQLAPRVASIEYEWSDGERIRYDAVDGYVAIEHYGRLDRPLRGDAALFFNSYRGVIFRNARGQILAADPPVGDLPYPQRIHARGRPFGPANL